MRPNQEQGFHPENIPIAISHFRSDSQVPVLNEKQYDGGQCRIFKTDFPDGESWAVRIPLHVRNASREAIISLIKDEVDVLQELEMKGFRWAAKHRGSSLIFENLIGHPFIALTWIPGTQLS
jgi:hypothetical protein